ncbi:MAG TPA: ATP-binding protein, partial [Rhodocyclaceae bacterium]|nr:ATP-binding protein [Rhodocyclaceae bacterium]
RLERELKDSERKVQDQMGMMVHILQADPRMMQEFLRNAVEGLDQINQELKTSSATAGLSSRRIDTIFRIAHRLKGDANALNLETVAQSLHSFENLLDGLRASPSLQNEDFLPVTVRVKGLYVELNAIQEALARIAQVRGVVTVEAPKPAHDPAVASLPFVRQWRSFAQQIAQRHNKQVELSYQGLDLDTLGGSLHEAVNSIVNQFIRNSIAHGVEEPGVRKQHGKPEAGRISVYISDAGDGNIELSFRDDGAGINPEKIRAAAVRMGKLSAEMAAQADLRHLIPFIFEPGVSARETVDEDSGRGVGLDTVKDIITKMGGRVRVGTTPGQYCHFRVQLPLPLAPRDQGVDATAREAA